VIKRDKALLAVVAGIGLGGALIASVLALSPQKPQLWIESEGRQLVDLKPCLMTRANEFSKTEREARAASAKPTTAEQFAYVAHFIAIVCMADQEHTLSKMSGLEQPEARKMVEDRLTGDAAALILRADRGDSGGALRSSSSFIAGPSQ
jgi:hypothetical protein